MLNRVNELNIIKSYIGIYQLDGNGTPPTRDSYLDNYSSGDSRLKLHIDFKDSQRQRDYQLAGLNGISALFYGELYNFDELIDKLNWNDGENRDLSFSQLCCLLYQKYGLDFAKHINGMFSLVLRDRKENVFLLIVDRFGSARPIYYNISSKLYFSTHLKHLLSSDEISADIDKNSLALFLKYSYIPSPMTIVKGIKKLKPGEMIICKRDTCKIARYIDFETKPKKVSEKEAVYQYTKLISESISNKLETYDGQNVGIFLSGGLDSSANVALAAKLNKCKFETFGIGFEDSSVDERPFANIVAKHFGIPFSDYVFDGSEIEDLPRMIWHLEEPFLENGLFLTYAGFKSVQNRADVIISGNCADQLFGTGGFAGGKPIALRYLLEKLHLLYLFEQAKKITRTPLFYKDNVLFKLKVLLDRGTNFNDWFFWGFDDHELKQLCKFDIPSTIFNVFPSNLATTSQSFADYYQQSLVHQDIEHYACQNVLVKSNRLAEMFGIYARDPYLDYKVVDFILSLELQLQRKGGLLGYFQNRTESKYLHRLAMRKMLPQSILDKPKQGGCVSMALLLSNPKKRRLIFNYILGSDILKEYLSIQYIKKLLAEYEVLTKKSIYWENHRDSKANKILYLLTFSLWHHIFLKNREKHTWDIKLSEMLCAL